MRVQCIEVGYGEETRIEVSHRDGTTRRSMLFAIVIRI